MRSSSICRRVLLNVPFCWSRAQPNPNAWWHPPSTSNVALAACAHYPDHHPFLDQDIEAWNAYGQAHGVQDLVTTAKDAARLDPWLPQLAVGAFGSSLWRCNGRMKTRWTRSSTPGSAPYLRDMTHAFSRFMFAATCWAAASAWIGCDSPSASGPCRNHFRRDPRGQARQFCRASQLSPRQPGQCRRSHAGLGRQLHIDTRESTRVGTPPACRQPHQPLGAHHRQHRTSARARLGHASGAITWSGRTSTDRRNRWRWPNCTTSSCPSPPG